MASGEKVFTEGVRGKTVKEVVLGDDDVELEISIFFLDSTSFNIRLVPPRIEVVGVDILGWKAGNSRVIRKLL